MPSGVVHERVNLIVLGGISLGYWAAGQPSTQQLALAFVVAYVVGTLWITPDLDLAEQRVRSKHHWGVLAFLWYPYGKLSRHRGLSHSWVVGPAVRLAYIALMLWALYSVLAALCSSLRIEGLSLHLGLPPAEVVQGGALGYWVSQWMHLVLDGVWPDFKKKTKR